MSSKEIIQRDIAIIGAGYAGIAAAKHLFEMNKDFIILEARDRIGGRTLSETLSSGAKVEFGAQWIGPTQYKMWEWVKQTNTQTYDTYDSGMNILSLNNKLTQYTGTIPKIAPHALIDLGMALNKINKLCKEINLEKPWEHAKAHEYDSMTLHTWIEKNMFTKTGKYLFNVGVETVFAAESSEISFLHALFYCASGDNMDTLIAVKNGAQQTLLVDGTQTLLQNIASPFIERIYTNQQVYSIDQNNFGVKIETDDYIINAKKCINTIPPTLLNSVKFSPQLPQRKAQLLQRFPMGAAMKCFCIYDKPFWRKMNFSGQIVTDIFPTKITFDCTDKDEDKGVLLVFVEANDARNFIEYPEEKRKNMIIEGLVKIFGEQAKNIIEYKDKCWTEEKFSRGCYAANLPTGVLSNFKNTMREPYLHLHFAGTETSTKWNGYMEGAILSGIRAAEEILNVNE